MSIVRRFYRRNTRKARGTNTLAHGKQTPNSFFDFGAEHSFFPGKPKDSIVTRKCDSCEKEDKVQKKETGSGNTAPATTTSSIKSLQGGSTLSGATRQFFEPRFSADFSDVKIHNDRSSHQLASSINARAFTYKNNIVFNRGQYDTESQDGKSLLAHELTHVVQQNPAVSKKEVENNEEEKVQRTPTTSDFAITGLDPGSAANDSIIRFDAGQTSVASSEAAKIRRQAVAQSGVELNLNGFTSEEGTPAVNTRVVNARINNVDRLLASAGHTGVRHKIPNTSAGEGNKDYRSRRVVEIKPTFVSMGVPSVSSVDPCTTTTIPCATSVLGIIPTSISRVVRAIAALSTPTPATTTQLSTFFGATPAATVQSNLAALIGQIATLTMAHDPATDCHKDACDSLCSSGADAYVNVNVSPAKMIFCESVMGKSADERSETFIHEALHATPGVMTRDIAYAHTRKMLTLSDAEKLQNTDNYVMLIRMLHNPAATATAPPTDVVAGTTSTGEIDFARKVTAFVEQWLISSKFTSGGLYGEVHNALTNPAGWQSSAGWYHNTMRDFNPLFGVTDPGSAAPFTVPTVDDKVRIAGLADRYLRMRGVLHGSPITVNKIGSGSEAWARELGNRVNVLASFFTKPEVDAIKHLILLMLKSMGDVPSSLRTAYVEGADKMRGHEGVGP